MKKEKTLAAVNQNYKDTVFRMIFKEKKELLSLYNAINNSHYVKEEDLQIATLENAIYMNVKNDLAFLIDFYLCLYEHQSTYNPNMPLRDLFYVSDEYQKLIDSHTLYTSAIVKIPAPKFIVFYNGRKQIAETLQLKLSDVYYVEEEEPDLELKVTMLNLNAGNHRKILDNCQTLKEYMLYVECVRKYAARQDITLDMAVNYAVDECIRENILADFLRKNKAEAIKMSIYEFDEEREWALMRKTEYNVGVEDGIRKVASRMLSAGTYTVEEIADISGLAKETVLKLEKEVKA